MAFHSIILAGYSSYLAYTRPTGAYVIANVFRRSGLTSVVINNATRNFDDNIKTLLKKYSGEETKFVCISTTLMGDKGYEIPSSVQLKIKLDKIISEIKQIVPNAKIIVGGSATSFDLEPPTGADFIVKGQGEESLRAIINNVLFGDNLIIDQDRVVSDKVYGYPEYNSESLLEFNEHDCVEYKETLPIEFGRGCVFRCSYCNYQLIGKSQSDFTKTEETLYRSIMTNYENSGTENYIIVDDTINDSLEKALTLQKVVKRLPFKFQFGGYMRLELFHKHPEMAEIYHECGLKSPTFGIESFNKNAGSLVGKGFGEKAKDVLEFLMDKWGNDVSIVCNFIVGLPYDTVELLQKQYDWLKKSNLGRCHFTPLSIRKNDPSALTEGTLRGYYELSNLSTNPDYYNWKSDYLNRSEAHRLGKEMFDDYVKSRNKLFQTINGFSLISILSEVSWDELSKPPTINPDMFLVNIAERRIKKYNEKMNNMVPPNTPLPKEKYFTPVPHTGIFTPKITMEHIRHRGKKNESL